MVEIKNAKDTEDGFGVGIERKERGEYMSSKKKGRIGSSFEGFRYSRPRGRLAAK